MTKIPAPISPAVALSTRHLDVYVGRINAALGEPWTPEERKNGRILGMKFATYETRDLAYLFRNAGWAVKVKDDTMVFRPMALV